MPHIGAPELAVVLVLALVIFGPGKLPDVGKSIKEFKSASKEVKEQSEKILEEK